MITELSLRIDWSELDLFGHVNNVSFFKYIQAARIHYWEQLGLLKEHAAQGPGFMLASSSCTFKKPLHYPGTLRIESKASFVKNSSFGLHHVIYDTEGHACAEANDVLVLYDFTRNEKVLIPDNFRTKMNAPAGA